MDKPLPKPSQIRTLAMAFLLALNLFFANTTKAQVPNRDSLFFELEMSDYRLEKKGMKVLAAWSVGNFALSGGMLLAGEGHNPDFHRTNIYWNLVNFGLATSSLIRAKQPTSGQSFSLTGLDKHYKYEKTLLLNVGLDAGYMAAGFWMQERGKRIGGKSGNTWQGMGQSLILQGAFLFVFDTVLHQLFNRNKKKFLSKFAF